VSCITIWSSKNALILNFSILFDGKVNLVDASGNLKFPIVFKERKKQFRKNRNYYVKSVFDKIDFGF